VIPGFRAKYRRHSRRAFAYLKVDFLLLFGLVGNEGRKRNQLQDTELTRDQASEVEKLPKAKWQNTNG
jgi:hypothetical protein